MATRQQQREQTREQILATSRELLDSRPYSEFSIATVMQATGLTRPAFYRHFDGVASLLAALIAEIGDELQAAGRAWSGAITVGPETARLHLAEIVRVFTDNLGLLQALSEASHREPALAALRAAYNDAITSEMTASFEERIAAGDLPPFDAAQVSRALMAMIEGYLLDALSQGVDPDTAVDTVWFTWSRVVGFHGQPDRPRN